MHKPTCKLFVWRIKMSEEKENKCKKCLYCGNYEGYYTKGLRRFESIKKGHCQMSDKIVDHNSGCENWRSSYRKFNFRKRVATRALYEILMDLSTIRQILQESQDEGKNLK